MSALPSEIGLTGKLRDPIQPTLQRFISRDPIGLSGGENLYSYCGNNPTLRNDPMGLEPGGERDWIDEYNEAMTKWYQEHPYGRPHLEFDRGKSKEDCMKNCMKVFDLLPESWELPLQIVLSMGLPIPKSIPKALGMTGGATGPSPGRRLASSTTLGSLLAQQFYKATGVRIRPLRQASRVLNPILILYLLHDTLVYQLCKEECGLDCGEKMRPAPRDGGGL
ncbi:MAG TPA: RHS repeat-associated core domain-containing protein [Candidatus Obscuribacter sp.]|nr:RHS repeat-associated core domain-containing protein [Candidatus Obscuribacter sp.]